MFDIITDSACDWTPEEARDYVEYLEKAVGCKITYISVGAEREAYIHHVV